MTTTENIYSEKSNHPYGKGRAVLQSGSLLEASESQGTVFLLHIFFLFIFIQMCVWSMKGKQAALMGSFSCLGSGLRGFKAKIVCSEGTAVQSPPVTDDCRDLLELVLVKTWASVGHSVTSTSKQS